jgi:hypothetical protein
LRLYDEADAHRLRSLPDERNRKRDSERWQRIANNYLQSVRAGHSDRAAGARVQFQLWKDGNEMYLGG